MHSREQLASDIRKLRIEAGNTILLHASVRAVGEIAGGPDQIHLAFKDVLTAQGTLMMYASCPRYFGGPELFRIVYINACLYQRQSISTIVTIKLNSAAVLLAPERRL